MKRSSVLAVLLAAGLAVPVSVGVVLSTGSPAGADRVIAARDAGGQRGEVNADEALPIRRITLFRSGVGYIERSGTVSGDATLQMRFDADQINDILKSLVLLDLDGGRIDSVSYASKDPLDRRMASFLVPIGDNPSMPELFKRLRGAEVTVSLLEERIVGTILGVEQRAVPVTDERGNTRRETRPHLNLVTDDRIRSIAFEKIYDIHLTDPQLRTELTRALRTLGEERLDHIKTVDVALSGRGERTIYGAYVQETPVWKTSYRLVLQDKDSPGGQRDGRAAAGNPVGTEATLQGWAIVENTTDQDWRGIDLSLVSGQPVSFTMDLYQPLYLERPDIPVPVITGVRPREYEAALRRDIYMELEAHESVRGTVGTMDARMRREAPSPPGDPGGALSVSPDELIRRTQEVAAAAGQVGETFRYRVRTPVTIERQRSAMIPILSERVEPRRVSIYNSGDNRVHPMRGVEITNTSDLQLLPGPITVIDGDAEGSVYSGDAQIGHVAPGDKRLLAYAVDLDVHVTSRPSSSTRIQRIRIVGGMLEQTRVRRNSVMYEITNKDSRPRTLMIEHARLGDWELVEPDRPAERTGNLYRFEVDVPPAGSETLRVTQERIDSQRMEVSAAHEGTLLTYHRDGRVSDEVLEAFRRIAAMQAEIRRTGEQISQIEGRIDEIDRDQRRIRENMRALDANTDLYRRYVATLTEQEAELSTLRDRREELREQRDRQQAELEEFLRGLNVD